MKQKSSVPIEAKLLSQMVDYLKPRELFQQAILSDNDGSFKALICSDLGVNDEYFDFLRDAYILTNSNQDEDEWLKELQQFINNNLDDSPRSEKMHLPQRLKEPLYHGKDLLAEGEIKKEQFLKFHFEPLITNIENDVYLNTYHLFLPVLCPELFEKEEDTKSTGCAPVKCSIL